jgi:hypothetical protein
MKTIEIGFYGDEERKYYFVNEDELVKGLYDEEGNFYEDENGTVKGFYADGRWLTEEELDCFNIIEDYKEIDRDYDFYGTGYDRVKAIAEGEEIYLRASRWTSGTETGSYYTYEGWV